MKTHYCFGMGRIVTFVENLIIGVVLGSGQESKKRYFLENNKGVITGYIAQMA